MYCIRRLWQYFSEIMTNFIHLCMRVCVLSFTTVSKYPSQFVSI
uniref:Uncharacterized protein n=1 Tax=Anguilla anguilla TaxID=7936 RepID=A0A0E9RHJ7_ANGAN